MEVPIMAIPSAGQDFNPQASPFRPSLPPSARTRQPLLPRSSTSSRNASSRSTPDNIQPITRYPSSLPFAPYFPGHYGPAFSFAVPISAGIGTYPPHSLTWAGWDPSAIYHTTSNISRLAPQPLETCEPQPPDLTPSDTNPNQQPSFEDQSSLTEAQDSEAISAKLQYETVEGVTRAAAREPVKKASGAASPERELLGPGPFGFQLGGNSTWPNKWSWDMSTNAGSSSNETAEDATEPELPLEEVARTTLGFLRVDTPSPEQQDRKCGQDDTASVSSHHDRNNTGVGTRGPTQLQLAMQRARNTIAHAAARERAKVSASAAVPTQVPPIQEPGREQTVSPFQVPETRKKNTPLVVRTPVCDPRVITSVATQESKSKDAPSRANAPPASATPSPIRQQQVVSSMNELHPSSAPGVRELLELRTKAPQSGLSSSQAINAKRCTRLPPGFNWCEPSHSTTKPVGAMSASKPSFASPLIANTGLHLVSEFAQLNNLTMPLHAQKDISTVPALPEQENRTVPAILVAWAPPKSSQVPSRLTQTERASSVPRLQPFLPAPILRSTSAIGNSSTIMVETRPYHHIADYYDSSRPPRMGQYKPLPEDWYTAYPLVSLMPTGRRRTNREMARYLSKLERDFYSGSSLFGKNIHEVVEEVHVRHINAIYLDKKLGMSRFENETRWNLYSNLNKGYKVLTPYANMPIDEVVGMEKSKAIEPILVMLFRTLLLYRAEEGLPPSHRVWRSHFSTDARPTTINVPDIKSSIPEQDDGVPKDMSEVLDQEDYDEEEMEGQEEDEDGEDSERQEEEQQEEEEGGGVKNLPRRRKTRRRLRSRKRMLGYAC